MSSVQTVTSSSERGSTAGRFAGTLQSIGRRLSGTFIGSKPPAAMGLGKDKRPAVYSYDEETGQMRIAGLLVSDLAQEYQTPLYVYDVNRIVDNFHIYLKSLQSSVMNNNFTIAYGVKVRTYGDHLYERVTQWTELREIIQSVMYFERREEQANCEPRISSSKKKKKERGGKGVSIFPLIHVLWGRVSQSVSLFHEFAFMHSS